MIWHDLLTPIVKFVWSQKEAFIAALSKVCSLRFFLKNSTKWHEDPNFCHPRTWCPILSFVHLNRSKWGHASWSYLVRSCWEPFFGQCFDMTSLHQSRLKFEKWMALATYLHDIAQGISVTARCLLETSCGSVSAVSVELNHGFCGKLRQLTKIMKK